jgi:hypothetical protein
MKRLILLAAFAIATLAHQSAKAQVSISLNIGNRPYYAPDYYNYNAYYVPTRTVVYHERPVVYHRRPVVYQQRHVSYRPAYRSTRVYRTSYNRPSHHYTMKGKPHGYKSHGNGKGHGRGRH